VTDNNTESPSVRSFASKAGRGALALLSVLSACLLGLVGLLLRWSPGKPKPFVDKDGRPLAGSISEKTFVDINGAEQGMFIKGKDATNPVLLYLHGGMPDYFLTRRYPTGLEDHFTVCWWEQRGSGLSYGADLPPETMTLEQFVSDTLEVTDYLRDRFEKEKVFLMGHSGGTFIGIQAAARAPESYYAYIGVAQMSNQLESERRAYEYMLRRFREEGNEDVVEELEAAPVTARGGTPEGYLDLRDKGMHSLGVGTTHDMDSVVTGLFLPSLRFPEYTLTEKINLWRAKFSSGVSILWDKAIATDLSQELLELDVPVYFFHGIHDYTVNYALAKEYFEELEAPLKGFYTFEHSAHSPMFEEPEKARRVLREDVLAGTNGLADAG
jgi:pimeloyl-ACP methyl ester carboxylesterase